MTAILLSVILLFALWNGYVCVWGTHSDAAIRMKASKIWHGIALTSKLVICLRAIYYMPEHWFFIALTGFNLSWTAYDLIINLVRWKWQGLPILHIDAGYINSTVKKYVGFYGSWAIKFGLVLLNIILIFFLQ